MLNCWWQGCSIAGWYHGFPQGKALGGSWGGHWGSTDGHGGAGAIRWRQAPQGLTEACVALWESLRAPGVMTEPAGGPGAGDSQAWGHHGLARRPESSGWKRAVRMACSGALVSYESVNPSALGSTDCSCFIPRLEKLPISLFFLVKSSYSKQSNPILPTKMA